MKPLIIISTIILSACSSSYEFKSGYVTHDDPLRYECRDGEKVIVNNTGEWNSGEGC